MIVDLGALAVDAEANAIITVRAKSGAYDTAGKWVAGAPVDTAGIKAVVQPASGRTTASGRKLNDLPEGVRASAQHFLWTRFELALDNVVLYAGREWRVVFVWDRTAEAGYTRAAIGKLK